jgi:hypothetical protein
MTCEACGQTVTIGEWPFCPHGTPNVGVIDDQIEGGPRFFDTMGHEPVWIESKSQWRAEVAARNLVNVDKHDRAYYQRKFREHDERLRDTGAKA